jgi:hypothetical protein
MNPLQVLRDFFYRTFVAGGFETFAAATDHRCQLLLLSLSHERSRTE